MVTFTLAIHASRKALRVDFQKVVSSEMVTFTSAIHASRKAFTSTKERNHHPYGLEGSKRRRPLFAVKVLESGMPRILENIFLRVNEKALKLKVDNPRLVPFC